MTDDNGAIAQQDGAMTSKTRKAAPKAAPALPLRDRIGAQAGELRDMAVGRAQDYATQGKDKATELLDGLVELVDGAVSNLERNFGETELGANAGEYAQKAASALSGFTDRLRAKDVDELLDDAREAIRKNPAIAIGAAAAIGFVLARIVKAGMAEEEDAMAGDPTSEAGA